MKLRDSTQFNTITEILRVVTSRRKLKQVLAIPLYANAIYLISSTVFVSLLSFFFWLIAARFYDEGTVGYSSAIISSLNLLTVLCMVGLNISLIHSIPRTDKPQGLINTAFTVGGSISLVAAGIFIAGIDYWSPALDFIKHNLVFFLTFLVCAMLWTISSLVDTVFLAKRLAGFVFSKNATLSVLKLPLLILLATSFRAFGVVASWGIASIIVVAMALFLFLPRIQANYRLLPALDLNLLKSTWQYTSGNYLASLFSAAPGYLLPLMVVNLLDAKQNAYFYVAWMIANMLLMIPTAVSLSLFAEGSHFEHGLKENVMKSFKFSFLLLIPAAIMLMLAGKWLLLAFGQIYSLNALNLLWVLCLSALPYGIVSIYASILRVTSRIKELMAIGGFIAVATLSISYFLIPVTGIISIGYSWLGVNSIAAIYAFVRIRQEER